MKKFVGAIILSENVYPVLKKYIIKYPNKEPHAEHGYREMK